MRIKIIIENKIEKCSNDKEGREERRERGGEREGERERERKK